MMDLFSDEVRRNPYPLYEKLRRQSPLFQEPKTGLFLVFDYEGVKRLLTGHESFSSRHGPVEWLIFLDPPRHSKLRALVSQAFTPRSVANLEPRIRELATSLLERVINHGKMDVAADFSIPLPMLVIAEMLGIPGEDRNRFQRWNDVILNMSYAVVGSPDAAAAAAEFAGATREMSDYLGNLLDRRRSRPTDDLLTRLLQAEVENERLSHAEILGFFQLLLLAGSETTTNLLNNALLAFIENPQQLALLRAKPEMLPSAIEGTLRYRSPLQWMYRKTTRGVELHGHKVPAGSLVLAVMGSANHDPVQFPNPDRFDIGRNPNPHLAFGQGLHFCLGAALARLEAKVALGVFLDEVESFAYAGAGPWEPRKGLHVQGPQRLPIRLEQRSHRTKLDQVESLGACPCAWNDPG